MTDLYAAVEVIAQDTSLPTATICEVLDLSRSTYYGWISQEPGPRHQELDELTPIIVDVFLQHRRRYGARRIASELQDRGIDCSAKRVAKVLRNQGLRATQPKSFVPKTTESCHQLGYSPNLLLESDEPTRIDQVWVGDITYLPLKGGGFAYLAALMDRYSRDIVGWSIDSTMCECLVLTTLHQAIRDRQPKPGLVHHTDRGGQYAGGDYRAMLRRAKIQQSMSRADNCYDNAFMESCWSSLKRELEIAEYESVASARRVVAEYVRYYRFEWKHSAISYLTPHEFSTRSKAKK
jgi:putative transposase